MSSNLESGQLAPINTNPRQNDSETPTSHQNCNKNKLDRRETWATTQTIEPTGKDHAKELELFQFFVVTIIGISIFGASTFAVILGEMTDPADIWAPSSPTFTLKTVRLFLALSWLAFSMSIAIAGYSASFLALMRQSGGGEIDAETIRKWTPAGLVVSAALHLLIVTGFFFMSLCLVAYVGALGWVIVAISSMMFFIVLYLLSAQYRAL